MSEIKEIVIKSVATAVAICGSQAKLAKKAGLTQGAVGKYVRGETLPRGETAIVLSKAVGGELTPYDFAPHIFASAKPQLIVEKFVERRTAEQRLSERRNAERRALKPASSVQVLEAVNQESDTS